MRRKAKNIIEKQELQSQFQKTILQTQLEIQEQTLKTISQEIHDNIGQVLSLAKLNLNTMDISKTDELQDKILNSKNLVSKAIQDLRDLSRSLNTDNIAAMGLMRAIEYELELIRKSGVHQTQLNIEGTIIRLDAQKELIIFRIVQETINNIIKHANAKNIFIDAVFKSNLELSIKDDGDGFDKIEKETNLPSGMGLKNMESRAKMIGAEFSINSLSGNGTQVILQIPLNNSTE